MTYTYGATLTRDQIKDRRIAALEREVASLQHHNQRLRQRTETRIQLWPGDTPAICAARLEAAADEAQPQAPTPIRSHCPEGHELTEDNTTIDGPRRRCRTCRRAASQTRKKAA
ncbi:hypothetical protein ABDK96_01930 [Citricoccus nitrophenolicus]|uniref:Uncharacterized protein n=1 Tax=Citricoccus nitrophenolicus TaxID=863575 RepID=A0ABV0IE46_9MICC